MVEPQVLLREYALLNRRRKGEGVTPLILEELCGVEDRNPKTVRDRAEPEPA